MNEYPALSASNSTNSANTGNIPEVTVNDVLKVMEELQREVYSPVPRLRRYTADQELLRKSGNILRFIHRSWVSRSLKIYTFRVFEMKKDNIPDFITYLQENRINVKQNKTEEVSQKVQGKTKQAEKESTAFKKNEQT